MQPVVKQLARPVTSALRLQARRSPGNAFICSGCLQSRQHHILPRSQSRPLNRRIHTTTTAVAAAAKSEAESAEKSHSFYRPDLDTSTDPVPSALTPPPFLITSGITRLSSRRLISVSGPDAVKYLQGVITANITNPDGTPRTEPFYAAFLTAKGRVLHDVFIYPYHPTSLSPPSLIPSQQLQQQQEPPTGESFIIEVDASEATRLQQHIKRYKLRAKFVVSLLDESEFQIWHAWSNKDGALAEFRENLLESNTALALAQDPRAPGLGYRIISRPSSPASSARIENSSFPLPLVPESAYTLHRYRLGVPEGQREILRDQALPLESNIDIMGGIDFRKGCYVGQELTIRTKHRGVVRKRILPVVVSSAEAAPPTATAVETPTTEEGEEEEGQGDSVDTLSSSSDLLGGFAYRPAISSSGNLSLPDTEARIGRKEKPDRRVGQWLAGIGNVGLALCRLEVMTDLQVPGETASAGFDPEKDEFVVSAGTGRAVTDGEKVSGSDVEAVSPPEGGPQLRVKAFVPGWLRSELEKPAH